jgi:hypothetical protein
MSGNHSNKSIGVLRPILIAVIPAVLLFFIQFLDNQRKDQLTRVDAQLQRLYGPLYALTVADSATWQTYSSTSCNRTKYLFSPAILRSVTDVDTWRVCMRNVFEPLNEKMEDAIVNNSQLMIGGTMPMTFQTLIVHTERYKAVIADWKPSDRKDVRSYTSRKTNVVEGLTYPVHIIACVSESFQALKSRQQQLEHFWSSLPRYTEPTLPDCNDVKETRPINRPARAAAP